MAVTQTSSHPTLADIAAIAGVSVKTASRAMNELDRVSPLTLEKVKKAAELVGYRSNRLARELRVGALSNLVGMVISDLANPFYAGMAAGAEEALSPSGMDLIIATARDDGNREKALIEALLERRVRGLIIVPSAQDYSYLHIERKRGVSFVFVDRPPAYLDADAVLADNFGGIEACVSYLASQGCNRIALIADNPEIWTASERIEAFKKSVVGHGLQATKCKVIPGVHTSEQAKIVALDLLAKQNGVDGFIASNDLIAIGLGHAITSTGAEIEMVSFDDFPSAQLMQIPTLDHDPKRLGTEAAKLLLERFDNPVESGFKTKTISLQLNAQLNLGAKS
jgi:LacI family transcriptional regulator